MKRLLADRRIQLGIHGIIIVALVASLVVTYYHQQYMTRGVSFGDNATPIPHTDVNPLGVNTFLHEEADPERVEQTLDMIADAGFTYVRQIFVWSEIEPAPGSFWDEQHGVSTWDKYDRIVELATERGLEIVARLDKPPRWTREGQPGIDQFPDGPPNDYGDFADFVYEVVSRYQGQIRYVQLWNEPNLGVEWGGYEIDPAGFTELLAVGYQAAKAANPEVTVLMPGLAPTDQPGPENLSDLLFLEGMYEAGAQDYFDIAAVMVYGYGFSPYDRRVSFGRNNFSRPIQTREIMERYGDEETPIWAVEYGWVALPGDWEGEPSPWGQPVTAEEQARYLYHGYLRAQREWPWMGAMMIWGFRWASDPNHPDQIANPTRGFRIVDHDFTPRPAYERLSGSQKIFDRAYTGSYTADSRHIRHDGEWTIEAGDGSQRLVPDRPGASLTIAFAGTGIRVRTTGQTGALAVTLNGEPVDGLPVDDSGDSIVSVQGLNDGSFSIGELDDQAHILGITLIEGGDDPLSVTGFSVERRTLLAWIYPYLYILIIMVLLINFAALAATIMTPQPAKRLDSYGLRSAGVLEQSA